MPEVMSAQERKWRAEDDARTLAQAQVVTKDPERLRLAQDAARKMAEEQKEQANAMQKVAGARKPANPGKPGNPRNRQRPTGSSGHNVFQNITTKK